MKTPLVVPLAKLVLFLGCVLTAFHHRATAAPGDLDPTFGVGGVVTTTVRPFYDYLQSVALQSDGKIVVAGISWDGSPNNYPLTRPIPVVARYNPNGVLDTDFGGTGIKNSAVNGTSVAVQSDGKILVAGSARNGGSYSTDFALVRYNTDGSVDFSVTADFSPSFPTDDIAHGVVVQSDGKIVVVGEGGGGPAFAVARFNADGSLDTSFGGTGKVLTAVGGNSSRGTGVALQGDGKIVVSGVSYNTSTMGSLVRYNSNGSVDLRVTTDFTTSDFAAAKNSVAIQHDGKIVVAGTSPNGSNTDFGLVRYNPNGSLDTSFGGTGRVITDFGGNSDDSAMSVAVQSDGKIVVIGSSFSGNNGGFALARYNSNGTLDTFFNGTGKIKTVIGNYAYGVGLVIQSDGNLVVAGTAIFGGNPVFALARYQGDPDTDGDGIPDRYETGTGIYVSPEDTGTSATNSDTDGDGLNDGEEMRTYHSNPNLKDTDGDGFDDGFEVATGFSPTSAASTPDALSSIRVAAEYRFNAALGVSYRIEASTDLTNWATIEPNITGTGGVITRFYSVEGQPKRFFRSRRN